MNSSFPKIDQSRSSPSSHSKEHPTQGQMVRNPPNRDSTGHRSKDQVTQQQSTTVALQAHVHLSGLTAIQQFEDASYDTNSKSARTSQLDPSIAATKDHSQSNSPSLVYYPVERPWQQVDQHRGKSSESMINASPMERWAQEGVRDQAWNGVARVYGDQQTELGYEWDELSDESSSLDVNLETCCWDHAVGNSKL